METTFESVPCLRGLSPVELLEIRGGSGPKELLWHVIGRAADCMIDEWDTMVECFKEGMEEAKG